MLCVTAVWSVIGWHNFTENINVRCFCLVCAVVNMHRRWTNIFINTITTKNYTALWSVNELLNMEEIAKSFAKCLGKSKHNCLTNQNCENYPCIKVYWISFQQGVTKRCRLYLLTNSALVIRVQMREEGGSCRVSANDTAVRITWRGAQINFGDLTPYLTNGFQVGKPTLVTVNGGKPRTISIREDPHR